MNFLGRPTQRLQAGGSGTLEEKPPSYAGVAIFYLADLSASNSSTFDPTTLQVAIRFGFVTPKTSLLLLLLLLFIGYLFVLNLGSGYA